jgi:polyhydroxybutyrate depolymerase
MFRFLLAILLATWLPQAFGQVSAPSYCGNGNSPGFHEIEVEGARREYLLHIPDELPEVSAVIINFHGFGDCANAYMDSVGRASSLNSLADQAGFVVAYPQAMVRQKGDPYWEPGDNGNNIEVNDVLFTRHLVEDIASKVSIDPSRLFAVGYSNGGMMAYDLACVASDLFPAVGIMSGVMLADTCASSDATSIIHFHGIADYVIPLDGSGEYPSVLENIEFWRDHNDIPAESLVSTSLESGDVTRDFYAGGRENTAVALYVINREYGKQGGHVWFTDPIDGLTPNQILWQFLSAASQETSPPQRALQPEVQWLLLKNTDEPNDAASEAN